MRPIVIAVALLLACEGSDPMAQSNLTPIKGLWTAANEHGVRPPGSLIIADDVEIRDGVAVKRRGQKQALAQGASSVIPFQDRLLLHSGSVLSYTDEGVTAATAYAGSIIAPAGRKLRAASANGNAYIATATGVKRLDSVIGTPVDAGVPMGLDVQGSVTGSSGFLADDSAVAYRAVWGTRDANGNLILGAPSGRAVVVNEAGGSRDVSASTSIPSGVGVDHFWQLYRTAPSVSAATDPGDEMGLVFEGPRPANAAVTQLARATNVVTATTGAAHGFATGQIVRVSPGGSGGAGNFAAVGTSVAASSPDGITWTARTLGINAQAVAWNGALFAAVGPSGAATSPDGVTWTARTIPAFSWQAVAWNGSVFVAVSVNSGGVAAATSPDGITWTQRTIPTGSYYAIAWSGSQFVAAGTVYATSPDGITWTSRGSVGGTIQGLAWTGAQFVAAGFSNFGATSPDGITWTTRTLPAGAYYAIAWTGTTLVAIGPNVCATSSDGITWTARTIPAGFWYGLTLNGTALIVVGTDVAATSPDGITWTSRTIPAGTYNAVASGPGFSFAAGEKTLTGTPTTATFTYAETGADGTLVQSQTAVPLTATVVDQIPSTFAGATLYTSQSQEGILSSAYEPPGCVDIAEFRGSLFWLATTDRATLDLYLLASGAPSGVQAGDTLTVNGIAYTAAAAESIGAREFKVYTAGTPSQNVRDTAASLVRVVNRAQGSAVYARDLSGANDAPGHLQLTTRAREDSIAIAVSRSASFALTDGTTAAPETKAHELRWSPNGKPDAAPILNTRTLGDKNKAGLRVLALRDSVFILKRDGIWRLTGDNASWSVTPFDTTTEIIAPESAVVLDNTILALSSKGVVQVSDTGVTIISGPISDLIDRLLAEPLLSQVRTLAHGVANESEGKFILWAPTLSTDTVATFAYVYDHFESMKQGSPVWTTRSEDATAAVVNPKDGLLYRATASTLHRQRKALDYTDYSDGETAVTIASFTGSSVTLSAEVGSDGDAIEQDGSVAVILERDGAVLTLDRVWGGTTGAATLHTAINSIVEFAPSIPVPGAAAFYSEVSFLFRALAGGKMLAEFGTEITRGDSLPIFPLVLPADLSEGYAGVTFYGTRDYGLTEAALFPINLRTWVPRDQQRAERLSVRFSHSQALSPMALEGLSLVYSGVSTRLRR